MSADDVVDEVSGPDLTSVKGGKRFDCSNFGAKQY